MAGQLTSADFESLIGQRFELVPPGGDGVEIVLSTCDAGVPARRGGRVPVSLVFHAGPEPIVPQQVCLLRHPELGELESFVVPIVPDRRGARYEIVLT